MGETKRNTESMDTLSDTGSKSGFLAINNYSTRIPRLEEVVPDSATNYVTKPQSVTGKGKSSRGGCVD